MTTVPTQRVTIYWWSVSIFSFYIIIFSQLVFVFHHLEYFCIILDHILACSSFFLRKILIPLTSCFLKAFLVFFIVSTWKINFFYIREKNKKSYKNLILKNGFRIFFPLLLSKFYVAVNIIWVIKIMKANILKRKT